MAFAFTPTTIRIYEFIKEFKILHDGNSPSTREIAIHTGLSTSIIFAHLRDLENFGLIKVDGFKSRMISVVGGTWTPPASHELSDIDKRKLLQAAKA